MASISNDVFQLRFDMSDTKHSPLPWALETVGTQIGVCHKINMNAAGRFTHACLYDDCGVGSINNPNHWNQQLRANAELIVRCVNSHDALVEALKDLIRQLPNDERLADFNLDRAEAALAEAEQKTEG